MSFARSLCADRALSQALLENGASNVCLRLIEPYDQALLIGVIFDS
jgi:hypothetical protein